VFAGARRYRSNPRPSADAVHTKPSLHLRSLLWLPAILLLFGCDELYQVSDSGHGAYEASLATLPDGFAVAWYDDRDGNPEIYFRLINARGRPKGPEHRITNDPEFSYEPDIVAVENKLAIAWYERSVNGSRHTKLGMWSPSGEQQWAITVSSRNARNILVRSYGQKLFCAWIEDDTPDRSAVWGGWWDLRGKALAPARRLAPASRTTWNLNAAVGQDGAMWVVFDAKVNTRSDELFLVREPDTGAEQVAHLSSDDGHSSKYPDLALNADAAALTWFDERDGNKEVYLFAGRASELSAGSEEHARRITKTPGESIGSYVAWNGARIGLAWCDNTAAQHEIYFQPFDISGVPLHDAVRITHSSNESLIPAIKSWLDRFVLVWNEYVPRGPGHTPGGRSEIVASTAR
jgi:hypothetical protein